MSRFVVWSSTAFYFPHTSGALLQFSIVLMLSQRHRQSENERTLLVELWHEKELEKSPQYTHAHTTRDGDVARGSCFTPAHNPESNSVPIDMLTFL